MGRRRPGETLHGFFDGEGHEERAHHGEHHVRRIELAVEQAVALAGATRVEHHVHLAGEDPLHERTAMNRLAHEQPGRMRMLAERRDQSIGQDVQPLDGAPRVDQRLQNHLLQLVDERDEDPLVKRVLRREVVKE